MWLEPETFYSKKHNIAIVGKTQIDKMIVAYNNLKYLHHFWQNNYFKLKSRKQHIAIVGQAETDKIMVVMQGCQPMASGQLGVIGWSNPSEELPHHFENVC